MVVTYKGDELKAIKEIDKEIEVLLLKKKELLETKRGESKLEVMRLIKLFEFTAQELGLNSKKTKNALPIKYKHPETGLTWTGKGRCPAGLQGTDGKVNLDYAV